MKKISAIIAAITLSASMSAPAFASGFAQSLGTVAANNDSINIIYNGQLMTYTDAFPENINDRVMLPFRAVLEGMGATVNYTDATRHVTANRKDVTIEFTLLDDTIYIKDNNGERQIKMDVPMIIKNDRTLVPIRFISNALGMQVGWEGDYQTVLIVDADAYASELEAVTPNLTALAQKNVGAYNASAIDMSMKFNTNGIDSSASMKFNGKTAENVSEISGKMSADVSGLDEKVTPVKDADVEIVAADGKFYIKTDLIKKMFTSNTDSVVASSDKNWFYIDTKELVAQILGDEIPDGVKELYAGMLSGDMSAFENLSLTEVIASMNKTEGDATLMSAMQADMTIDAYKVIDKYLKVTDDKVEITFTKDNLNEVFKEMGLSENEISETMNMLDFDVHSVTEYGEDKAKSKADITLGVKESDTSYFMLTLNLTETDTVEDGVKPAAIPQNAVDLMSVIELLK